MRKRQTDRQTGIDRETERKMDKNIFMLNLPGGSKY